MVKRTASLMLQIETLVCLMHLTATAQRQPNSDQSDSVTADRAYDADVELMRQDLRAKRKQVIAANMPLTTAEATAFWPVYDRYIAETVKINDTRYALIKDYAKNYDTMTDDQADTFIKGWVTLDRDDTDLRLQYVPEFQKVISHKKTALFFQADRRVAMMISLQLAGQVPLVKP
jgi:hypothetical protein